MNAIYIQSAAEWAGVELYGMVPGRLNAVDQSSDHTSQHIVDNNPDMLRARDGVPNLRRWIKGIGVVLLQSELSGHLSRLLLIAHRRSDRAKPPDFGPGTG